ncbi:MAG: DUF3095 domain-containing protein [Gallionella sp.]|nr:DUF3095 domain-containing protein [Gallionella sp.]
MNTNLPIMPVAQTLNFYRDLPAMLTFSEATGAHFHVDVPEDWWVVVADVEGSTKAIEAGEYKKVNTVGVACIAAVLNVDRQIELPFVFGGDGATFAIPELLREPVIVALRGAQRLSRAGFGLGLRVGMVKVSDLVALGHSVRLGKVRLSPSALQTALSGRGWDEAERRVKTPSATGVLRVDEQMGEAEANFDGFSCRWQGVPSFQDHKLSLLIAASSAESGQVVATYQRVLAHIQSIYGEVESYHPLRSNALTMTFKPRLLLHEWRVQTEDLSAIYRVVYGVKMLFQGIAGHMMFAFNLNTKSVKWSRYREELVENSDFRKFDGMLRMVIDGSEQQATELENYLGQERTAGQLVYGIHKSREALVTCLVQSYKDNHLHFVDGSDGGYALAARQLKQQLAQQKTMP